MRGFVFIIVCLFSSISIAQSSGSITGKLIDLEDYNQPLILAKVLVKETGSYVYSDENGSFAIHNLDKRICTLIINFPGYETKVEQVVIQSGKAVNVNLYLKPSTITFNELMSTLEARADNKKDSKTLEQ